MTGRVVPRGMVLATEPPEVERQAQDWHHRFARAGWWLDCARCRYGNPWYADAQASMAADLGVRINELYAVPTRPPRQGWQGQARV